MMSYPQDTVCIAIMMNIDINTGPIANSFMNTVLTNRPVGVSNISSETPENFKLYQNFPNPFNSSTVFKFEIPKLNYGLSNEVRGGYVKIVTYNALGQLVNSLVNEVLQPGIYKVEWNGNDLASGIYYYRLLVTDPLSSKIIYSLSRKMVMIK